MPNVRNIGESLHHQAKNAEEASKRVLKIETAAHQSTEREWTAIFPKPDGEPTVISLAFLAQFPNIGHLLLNGYKTYLQKLSDKSRTACAGHLRAGFCKFLTEKGKTTISLNDLNRNLMIAFKKWLERGIPQLVTHRLSNRTIRNYMNSLKQVLKGLRSDKVHGMSARQAIAAMPKSNDPVSKRKPRDRISHGQLDALVKSAERDVKSFITLLNSSAEVRKSQPTHMTFYEHKENSPLTDKERKILSELFYLINEEGIIPNSDYLKNNLKHLFYESAKFKLSRLVKHLHPGPYELVPIVLLIAAFTGLNADTILTIKLEDIKYDTIFGVRVIRFTPIKMRGAKDPVISFTCDNVHGMGLDLLIQLSLEWTASIRDMAPREYKDRLFLFVGSGHTVKSWNTLQPTLGTWHAALKRWIKFHGLDDFCLSQVRCTVIDEVQQRTGDVLTSQAIAGHKSPLTTWTAYTSRTTKKLQQEKLAQTMMLRDRTVTSNGKFDPRRIALSQDPGAATPGFFCLDPFASPFEPSYSPDTKRLCKAYGKCPSCPLAACDIGNPANVAHLIALDVAIEQARRSIDPAIFALQWQDVKEDLLSLLSTVPIETMNKAFQYNLSLPSVG